MEQKLIELSDLQTGNWINCILLMAMCMTESIELLSGKMLCDKHVVNIASYDDVYFCSLMSQLSDVNIHSSAGMFTFYDVSCDSIVAEIIN